MKRTLAFLLLLAILISLAACTPEAAHETANPVSDTQGQETTEPVSGTQSPETTGFVSEEAQLARIRQDVETFLRAHPEEMEALAEVMLRSREETVQYQFYPDDTLYWYNNSDYRPQGQLDDHPILDAAGFLRGTEIFSLICVSDWELGSLGCVFRNAVHDPTGHPLYWCDLIWCPDYSGDQAVRSEAAFPVEEILPGWYWYLEHTPDGPEVEADS